MSSARQPAAIAPGPRGASAVDLGDIALVVLAAIVTLRTVVAFAAQTAFDVDPAISPAPWGGLGMAGSLALDALLLAVAALALLASWRKGRSVSIGAMVLSLAPGIVIIAHGWSDAGDLWIGSTWLASMTAAAVLLHLAHDHQRRCMVLALLLGVAGPLLLRGVSQMTWEHDATVAEYQRTREQFLAFQGWEPDSPAARIYERRLTQRQPLGWFATTNILGTMLAAMAAGCAAVTIAAIRRRLPGGWAGVTAILAAACAGTLAFTGSKGAILSLGVAGIAWLILSAGRNARWQRPGGLVLGLIIVTILAVVVRGAVVGESWLGERSLLFRWHYWIASAAMLADHPMAGVGPGGFQAAYTVHRVPRNPEEVASAHNVMFDWMTCLGLLGLCWIGLWAWRLLAIRWPTVESDQTPATGGVAVLFLGAAIAVGVGSIACEWPVLVTAGGVDVQSVAIRLLGFGLMPVLVAILYRVLISIGERQARLAALVAAVAMLVHVQIEMTMTQHGAVGWCAALLAVACAGAPSGRRSSRPVATMAFAVGVLLLGGWMAWRGAAPAFAQGRMMNRAASVVAPLAQDPNDAPVQRRSDAARQLVMAYERWPLNVRPLDAAVVQLELAAMNARHPLPGVIEQALQLAERAIAEHGQTSSLVLAAGLYARLAAASGDQKHWERAIVLCRRITEIDPHGISSWRRLGDVQWLAGDRAGAAMAYRRALACDREFELDPLKQMTDDARTILHQRIDQASLPGSP